MAVITPLFDAPAASTAVEWPVVQRSSGTARFRRSLRLNETKVLTVVAFVGYVASGLWVNFGLHFWVNDALSRTGDAVYSTVGQDPHFGGIGFYWPPLPQLIELIFVPFLRPFGQEILAGPLMTATCMAATVAVLGRLGHRIGVGRFTTFVICLVFAVTPDMLFTASNGMAESCFILSGAVALLGFLTWIRGHETTDLLVFCLGLSMLALTRLEGPLIVIALVVIAVFDLRHLGRSAWRGLVIALPPLFCYGLWLLIQLILLKDPLFFLHQNGGAGPAAGANPILPAHIYQHPSIGITWVLGWVVVLGPIMFLLAATIVFKPWSKRVRGSLGIVAGLVAVLALQAYTAVKGGAFGDPRYFVMTVIFATVAALWLAATPGWRRRGNRNLESVRAFFGGIWNICLVTFLVLAAGTGSYALTSGRITHVEQECQYFQYGVAAVIPSLGRPQSGTYGCYRPGNRLASWQEADHWIDSHLTDRDRIVADNAANLPAQLFTKKPGIFIVRNDRNWAKTIAFPRHVNYIITQATVANGPPSTAAFYAQDEGAVLINMDPSGWHLVKAFGSDGAFVQLWHFVPSLSAGSVPIGTQAQF